MLFIPTLDWQRSYKKDKSGLYEAILALPEQIKATVEEIELLKLPADYKKISNILVVGMGGSGLGAIVAHGLLSEKMSVPLSLVNDYHLPGYVDESTLVVFSSYSGNTIEVLTAAAEVKKTKAKVLVIASGGKLKDWAVKNGYPLYGMSKLINPGNQPRMALGHSLMSLLSVINQLGFASISESEILESVEKLRSLVERWGRKKLTAVNPAKQLAQRLKGMGVVMISGRHLKGAAYVFKNELNENAKTFATRFEIPELGHHLLEGLGFPLEIKGGLTFLLFDSDLYEESIRKRLSITEEVVGKQGHDVVKLVPEGKSALCQVWEVILFGEFVSYYLAILNGVDPTPVPWVDYLKKRLD